MKEGWNSDSYVIVFTDDEAASVTQAYGIEKYIPGHRIVAILGWDDFIVEDTGGQRFKVPTVPLDLKHRKLLTDGTNWDVLEPDDRYTGRIKWHIKPLIFGGDANIGPNMAWVDHPQHQQLVRFWNDKYREMLQNG